MDTLSAELDCLVRPEMFVELSSPVDTTLKAILVKIGDEIVTGQPLVQLENSIEAAKVELAKQQVQSTSEIENKRVQLTFANRNLIRIEDLHKKKSVSLFDKDKAETEVQLAKIELQQAREKNASLNSPSNRPRRNWRCAPFAARWTESWSISMPTPANRWPNARS
jgi:multidrug efflux pump subunit AcrA (membrane-fusion protein)